MIDFHTHILPALDDGSKDIDMTAEMLRMETSMGVDMVIATPHFYAHRTGISRFLEKRERIFREAEKLIREEPGLPEIKTGAEVYYFQGMGKAGDIRELVIGSTDMILLELPFRPWDSDVLRDIDNIKDRQGLRVILAHVERYRDLQKDRSLYEEVLDHADVIQMNAGSFIEAGLLRRKALMKFAASGRRLIIGSDCHNTTSRKPNLRMGLDILGKKQGEEFADGIIQTLDDLFR